MKDNMKIGLITTDSHIHEKDAHNFIKSMRSILQVILWEDLIEWHIGGIKYGDIDLLSIIFNKSWLRDSNIVLHPASNGTSNLPISRIERYFKKIRINEDKTAVERDNDIFRECSLFFLFPTSLTDFKGRIQRFRDMLDKDISKYAILLSNGEEIEINVTEDNYILKQKKKLYLTKENEKEIQSNRISHAVEEEMNRGDFSLEDLIEEEEEEEYEEEEPTR